MIARCVDTGDVMTAVRFGRAHGLDVSIRSGGHNGPGLSLVDDGLVIDLSLLKGIRVDPETRTARVEPGCTWGDVDHATHAFGLATPSGIISTTGVGGLTLGGGHGYLTRKYGLTIDNLIGADVVMSNGTLVHANEKENTRLHPVKNVIAGPLFWPHREIRSRRRFTEGRYADFSGAIPVRRIDSKGSSRRPGRSLSHCSS